MREKTKPNKANLARSQTEFTAKTLLYRKLIPGQFCRVRLYGVGRARMRSIENIQILLLFDDDEALVD